MRIAAIDLGSNSFHMVIVDVSPAGGFQEVGRAKEMVRLGARTLARGHLSAASIRRGLEVLRGYRRLAESHRVEKVIAVATSAIREAGNGTDFLETAAQVLGVYPRAISGEEEARLIYLSALHSVQLGGRRSLVMDLGGGSLELAIGSGARPDLVVSEKIGVLRMSEEFAVADPLPPRQEKKIVQHVRETLAPHVQRIAEQGFEIAVGTSGTILALGSMAHHQATGSLPPALHHLTVSAESLRAVRRRLVGTELRDRLKMGGLDPSRADVIVTGAIIVDTLLEALGARELILSEWALREGIILRYIHRHPRMLARAEEYPDVRRRSVIELAERCVYDAEHSAHVTSLALSIFDGTRPLHGFGDAERQLLEYSGLLHDIGHHISHPGHHKHSYYLIKNGGLRGFDPVEVEIIANLTRYHRGGVPKKKHEGFAALPAPARKLVRVLSPMLQFGEALDRSHQQHIRSVEPSMRAGILRLRCLAVGDYDLELWGGRGKVDALQGALGVRVRLDIVSVADAPAKRRRRPAGARSA